EVDPMTFNWLEAISIQITLIPGIPIPSPRNQTLKLRCIAVEKESFSFLPCCKWVFSKNFPGVVPQELKRSASIGIHAKNSKGMRYSNKLTGKLVFKRALKPAKTNKKRA